MQSCRFAFAVHVLAVLANESKCASSASLAATVNTNPVVIRRLLIDLQNAGLIRTSRGPQGGAILAKPPKNISLWHVHSAVESRELFGQHPNPPSPHCPVGQGIEKVLGYVEKRANRSFSRELQMMSLADSSLASTGLPRPLWQENNPATPDRSPADCLRKRSTSYI
jgi:DNA-binding IscR family transcriptional regulator